MINLRIFGNKVISFSVGPIVSAFLAFISLPIMSWFFMQEDIGRYSIMQASVTGGGVILSMGLEQAYVRFYSTELNRGQLLKLTILPGLLLFITAVVVGVNFKTEISKLLYGVSNVSAFYFLAICVFFSYINGFLSLIFRMKGRGWEFSISQILSRLCIFIGLLCLYLSDFERDFFSLTLIFTVSLGVTFAFLIIVNKEYIIGAIYESIDFRKLKELYRFSLPLFGASVAYWLLISIDKYLLKGLSSLSEVATYSIAVTFASVVTILIAVFGNLWHPTVYRWHLDNVDFERYKVVIDCMVVFICLVWSLFGVFSWVLAYFIPYKYLSVEYLVVGCVVSPLLYLMSESTVVGIGITKKTNYSLIAGIIPLLLAVLLNYILIPRLGALGTTMSSMLSFYLFFLLRTEFSVMLWVRYPRVKMYVIISAYMVFTILFMYLHLKDSDISIWMLSTIWVSMFLITLFMYRKTLMKLHSILFS